MNFETNGIGNGNLAPAFNTTRGMTVTLKLVDLIFLAVTAGVWTATFFSFGIAVLLPN